MKKLLLLALFLSGITGSALTSSANGSCKAQFKYEVNTKVMTMLPATVIDFYDKSEGNVKLWYWDFGDGNTSTEQNPRHIFNHPLMAGPTDPEPNPYRTVSLTIITSDSCKSFYSETIKIMDGNVPPAPGTSCKAGFKYYQSAYDSINGTVSFQMTNRSEGDSLSYLWNFDNQTTSTEMEPSVTFDLTKPVRNVCLKISGAKGCTDLICDSVLIPNRNAPIISSPECVAAFGYAVNTKIKTLAPALVLDFYSKSEPAAVEWKWDFGDGNTSNEANPTHIFNFPLSKDSIAGGPSPFRKVTLTVKTVSGCTATTFETINIYMNGGQVAEPQAQCHAWFKYYRPTDVISVPEVVPYRLIDASEGKVVARLWQFEDGTTSTEAEPLVNFNISQPIQKVCLTIYTADSCSSTWCDVIYVSEIKPDSSSVIFPSGLYSMHFTSSFPPQMSSCAGYAKAQVYLNDSLVNASNYAWSTGETGQEVKGLCPTQTYTVKATAPDGTIVSSTFVFNSDGTVTQVPVNWWITGQSLNPIVQCKPANKDYTVEWQLCNGTTVTCDSVPLNSINCGGTQSNLILKDAAGNVVYSENISLKTMITRLNPDQVSTSVKIYPNPVKDVLNIQYAGKTLDEMQIEIFDMTGKTISLQKVSQVESGQNISLNVNALQKGMYVCKLVSDKRIVATQKFVK